MLVDTERVWVLPCPVDLIMRLEINERLIWAGGFMIKEKNTLLQRAAMARSITLTSSAYTASAISCLSGRALTWKRLLENGKMKKKTLFEHFLSNVLYSWMTPVSHILCLQYVSSAHTRYIALTYSTFAVHNWSTAEPQIHTIFISNPEVMQQHLFKKKLSALRSSLYIYKLEWIYARLNTI